jgi:cytochrome c oxidase subunit II
MSAWAAGVFASGFGSPVARSAERFDDLFSFILVLSAIFFTGIVATMTYFVVRYRRRSAGQRTSASHGNLKIEVIWALVPAALLIIIFAWGFRDFLYLGVAPRDAIEVRVTGQKWFWTFDYPADGISTNELTVPVDRPIKLVMSSMDVIHSFYVPAFRVKRDVLPNRYTVMWFEALEKGTYDVLCAEYCGTGHSKMLGKVKVVSQREYDDWLDSGGGMSGEGMSSVEFGKTLFTKQGCGTCHSVDGSKKVGPSFFKKYGTEERIKGGTTVLVDDNYLRESIMEPNAKVVEGYEPVMPTYSGRLKDKQVNALVDYIKSLQ